MLLGREAECARLDALLAAGREGTSGALVLRGEAGIGKTSLLDYAADRAFGMHVSRTSGIESEAELAFSGLYDLLQPFASHLSSLPEPQRAALAAALALGPPVGAERFAVCVATLGLVASVAEETPLLMICDDAQWLDPSSASALGFTARRLDAEAAVLLFAASTDADAQFDAPGLPQLPLTRLGPDDARALLESEAGEEIDEATAERILAGADGNPLALTALSALFGTGGANGAPELELLPAVRRTALRTMRELPPNARRALLVAAASVSGDRATIADALGELGLDAESLTTAEGAGLLAQKGDQLVFRHPVVRAAVYASAPAEERSAVHRALAAVTAGTKRDGRGAWHLAAATDAPHDESVALSLEEAARNARSRGGRAEAASAFERAAELTADPDDRARRFREAADDSRLLGQIEHALALLDRANGSSLSPAERARVAHLRGAIEMWNRSPDAAYVLLREEAESIAPSDEAKAARMLTDAAWACFMGGEIARGLATAEEAEALGEQTGGVTSTLAKAALGIGRLLSGDAANALPLFVGYADLLEADAPVRHPYQLIRPAGQVAIWLEEYDLARTATSAMVEAARAQIALGALPYALSTLSDLDFRTGNWVSASASAAEAVRIAEEGGQTSTLAFSLACLARVEAGQGREFECREHAGRALLFASSGVRAVGVFASSALALLELGLGRNEPAIAELDEVVRVSAQRGLREPSVIQSTPDLIEAYVRSGRREAAAEVLAAFEELAEKTQRTWALGAAARCRGLLVDNDEFEPQFELALGWHLRTPTPFERARTELCLGERRRRARRRSDARLPLRSALDTFEHLGAAPWAERARTELAATGETAHRRDPYAAEQLTPQELQVALIVGEGATNKEAGAALFLSPKTIETHLGRVYRKLGVRSRTDLARLLAAEGALTSPAPESVSPA